MPRGNPELTPAELLWIKELIKKDNIHPFYIWRKWKRIRVDVLRLDNNECQTCKSRGRYTRATVVHHIKHLKKYPQYALSIWIANETDEPIRQLISVCDACHEEEHPERLMQYKQRKKNHLTKERWD